MLDLCPHCGFNFAADKPITIGRWHLLVDEARYEGRDLLLTRSEAGALYAIAKTAGRTISYEALGARISDSEDPRGVATVAVCKLRKKLPMQPFETVWGRGYRWTASA